MVLLRPVRWDYFYDEVGRSVIGLVRKLIRLRRNRAQFRRGEHYLHNDYNLYSSRGVMLYSRHLNDAWSLVALNFSDTEVWVPYAFPRDGRYLEELHGLDNLEGVQAGNQTWLRLPSNYGRVWSWVEG